jgi:hypothetical protein
VAGDGADCGLVAVVVVDSVYCEVSEMERTFAGFWVDGAVREPEDRHTDGSRGVLVKVKDDNRFERFTVRGGAWDKVYWLDTTTPTELTPQQAFELLKVLSPKATHMRRDGDYPIIDKYEHIINWNGVTEYPPRERWRVPTDADKGKRCRFRNSGYPWSDCDGIFLCVSKNRFVVESTKGIASWKFCEVLE